MGTFTWSTGLGMLAFGLAVTMFIGIVGLIVIRSQAQQKRETNSRSSIQKQIEGLRR